MNPVATVATIHSFSDYSGPDLSSDVILAKGALNPGDGGGGIFVWNATSSATADGYTVIKPTSVTGAGRWILVSTSDGSGLPTLLDFGAVGDGSTDDTAAIQTAIDDVGATGGCLIIPAGTFKFANLDMTRINASFTAGLTLLGYGPSVSVLQQTNTATGNAIDISGSNWLRFESIGIQTGSSAETGILASRLDAGGGNCNHNSFVNVWVRGSSSLGAFVGIGNECTSYDRCWFDSNGMCSFYSGAYNNIGATSEFGTIQESVSNTANKATDTWFTTPKASGRNIWLSDGAGMVFSENCQSYATNSNTLEAHVYVDAPSSNEFGWKTSFIGCHFEANGNVFVFATGASAPTNAVYENFHITDCFCVNSGYKWVTTTGSDVVHTNFVFENNAGPYPVEMVDVQTSVISHFEDGATVSSSGAFDGCILRVQDGGLTGSTLGCHIETVALFADTGKNYDKYGAATGTQGRYIQYTPSSSAPDNTQLTAGMIAAAQPPGWDPCSVGGTAPYPVFWDGTAWKKMYS